MQIASTGDWRTPQSRKSSELLRTSLYSLEFEVCTLSRERPEAGESLDQNLKWIPISQMYGFLQIWFRAILQEIRI